MYFGTDTYSAVLYYELSWGEKIIFHQWVDVNREVILRGGGVIPYIKREYFLEGSPQFKRKIDYSVFSGEKTASVAAYHEAKAGGKEKDCRRIFSEARIYFPTLKCIISGSEYGCIFRDVETNATLSNRPIKVLEPFERGCIYLLLENMLGLVERTYGVSLHIEYFL